jgi:hypothetical protein
MSDWRGQQAMSWKALRSAGRPKVNPGPGVLSLNTRESCARNDMLLGGSFVMRRASLCGFLLMFLHCSPATADPDDADAQAGTWQAEPGIEERELTSLLSSDFASQIKEPTVLAFTRDDLVFWAERARDAHATAAVAVGDTNTTYDVVVQIGHFPRTTGKTGGQGIFVNEQQIAALVAAGLIQHLSAKTVHDEPIKALLIGADDFNPQLTTRVFLSLHTDSSKFPCRVGPSVGYQEVADAKGMHGIALALAITLGYDAEKFMRDNYTKNLSNYYAYSQFNALDCKGLLEMSELSCPEQEENLLSRASSLSENLAVAVQFALR